jgi:hypothetical protein
MTPEKRKLFFLIAIAAAVAGSYIEVLRHEKAKSAPAAAAPTPSTPAH